MHLDSQKMKNAVLTALADPEMVGIIESTMYKSKSAWDIIMEKKMPPTTAYRKIKWLVDEKLLNVDRILISADGKKSSLFHSVMRNIKVTYENSKLLVEAEQNTDSVDRLMEKFLSL